MLAEAYRVCPVLLAETYLASPSCETDGQPTSGSAAALPDRQAPSACPGHDKSVFKKEKNRPLLQPYWCKYDGTPAGRRDRMPHMKSYTRFRYD